MNSDTSFDATFNTIGRYTAAKEIAESAWLQRSNAISELTRWAESSNSYGTKTIHLIDTAHAATLLAAIEKANTQLTQALTDCNHYAQLCDRPTLHTRASGYSFRLRTDY